MPCARPGKPPPASRFGRRGGGQPTCA
jgi:hypothetical protein